MKVNSLRWVVKVPVGIKAKLQIQTLSREEEDSRD